MKVSCCKDSWINWIVDVWQSQPIICSCLVMIHVSDTCQTRVTTHSYHFRTSIVRGATTRLQHWSLRLQWSHTKVSNFYIVLIIQQQVLWLQISMTAIEMKIIWQTNKENYFHYHIEWLWQKSRAEIICLKNLLASLGVSLPFLTR